MAGWISSKLKVAENLLQQIDQQAAESLGKSDSKQHDELNFNTSPKPSANISSLKDQLKKKSSSSENNECFANSNIDSSKVKIEKRKQQGKEFVKPDLNPRSSVVNDSDWTELLSTPKQLNFTKKGRVGGGSRGLNVKYNGKGVVGTVAKAGDGNVLKVNGGVRDGRKDDEGSRNSYSSPRVSVVGSDDVASESDRKLGKIGVSDGKDEERGDFVKHDVDNDSLFRVKEQNVSGGFDRDVGVIDGKETVVDDEKIRRGSLTTEDDSNVQDVNRVSEDFESGSYSRSNNVSDSDSESSSTSDSESENEREREARIQRRRQILAAKAAAKTAEAIKEHENLVARLEGEKQSLEKIVEERGKQAAQEASELQLTMMEMMEAAEQEKQKHNHTRMEVLARLAKPETANADLAKSLATAQFNLELEVNRVVDFRQQVEVKEVVHEELRRRISSTCQTNISLPNFMLSKGIKFEKEMLEAEYSSLTDKVGGLQEKATKLEVNIDLAQKEIGNSTEVEVELKQRLHQMTDYLIQKQAQVEALSSDKAMLSFRIEAVTRLLDENKHLINAADLSSSSRDVEVGTCKGSGSKLRPMFEGRIQSGKQHLGSLLRQLDSVFSAGAVFVARNPVAKVWLLVYLVCLHLWVLYILFSHSRSAEDVTSSSLLSLGNINNNGA